MSRIFLILLIVLLANSGVSAWGAPASVKIDRVTIKGASAFPSSTLESLIEIYSGQLLEHQAIVLSEENVQAFYHSHGYDEMTVKVRLKQEVLSEEGSGRKVQNVLEFDISEGRSIRVAKIELEPEDLDQVVIKDLWNNEKEKLKSVLKIRPGDLLEQSKLSDAKRSIQEALLADEFVGSGVSRIEFEPDLGRVDNEGARWMKVRLRVDLGDRVLFGFRGNEYFTWNSLQAWVDDLRTAGLGKDYVEVVKKRIEDEYRAAGFAKVSVNVYTVEQSKGRTRKLVYSIEEGPRVRIESVEFDGNVSFTAEKLRSRLFSKASGVVQNGIYVEKDIRKAAELLTEWMKENGYLSSKLVAVNSLYLARPKSQQGNSSVKVMIYLYEGNQTILRNVEFRGLKQFDETQAKKELSVSDGEALNLFALTEGIEKLKRRYFDLGFLDFQIKNEGKEGLVRYSQENRQADITLEINEGLQYRVSRIQIEGLRNTESDIILRELLFREGDILGDSVMTLSERQLRRLGIFSSVAVRAIDDSGDEGKKVVVIKLSESDRGTLAWGPGIRTDLGLRLYGQFTYANLWGKNHTLSVTGSANRRFLYWNFWEGQAQVNYAWPWFLTPGLTFRPSLSVGRTQYLDFTLNQLSTSFAADNQTASLSWDKQLLAQTNLLGTFSYTFEGIRQFMGVRSEDNSSMTIGTVTPRITLDLRDNSLAPTSGFYSTAWFDFAPPALGSSSANGSIGYYRAQFRADYHWPLPYRLGLYFSFRTGFEQSIASTTNPNFNTIPLIKQFSLGGVGSLRGYNELELNTLTSQSLQGLQSSVIQGSLSYLNYRVQLDLPLTSSLKFDMFLDSANLLINKYGFEHMLYGAGCGARYLTPVGSVNLDWGFKLNPPPGTKDNFVFHFSVGVI